MLEKYSKHEEQESFEYGCKIIIASFRCVAYGLSQPV